MKKQMTGHMVWVNVETKKLEKVVDRVERAREELEAKDSLLAELYVSHIAQRQTIKTEFQVLILQCKSQWCFVNVEILRSSDAYLSSAMKKNQLGWRVTSWKSRSPIKTSNITSSYFTSRQTWMPWKLNWQFWCQRLKRRLWTILARE